MKRYVRIVSPAPAAQREMRLTMMNEGNIIYAVETGDSNHSDDDAS